MKTKIHLPLVFLIWGCAAPVPTAQVPAERDETNANEPKPESEAEPPSSRGEVEDVPEPRVESTQAPPSTLQPAQNLKEPSLISAIPSPCGLHVLVRRPNWNLSSLLVSKSTIQPVKDNPSLWIVDGVLIELKVLSADQLGSAHLRGQELLEKHRSTELERAAKENGWEIPEATVFISKKPREGSELHAEVWAYKPLGKLEVMGAQVVTISYATVAADDVILALAAPHVDGHDPGKSLTKFKSLLASVILEHKTLDLRELNRTLRSETQADPQCLRVHEAAAQ